MSGNDDRLPDYKRPTMDFERKATIGGGAMGWAAAGLEFAIYVALFFLAGQWLDGRFDSAPWGAALGGLLGAILGIVLLVRRALRASAPSHLPRDGPSPSDGPGDDAGDDAGPRSP